MKRWPVLIALAMVLFVIISTFASAQDRVADVQQYPNCKYCNMARQQFNFTRFLIEYDDGTVMPACSIHCAAVDLAETIDKTPVAVKVGDMQSKNLIDAESAVWVIGGDKPGVMTKRGKWAFEKKEVAEKFVKDNGGMIGSFDDAMKATYEDMYSDTKMIREKRKMKKMKMENKG